MGGGNGESGTFVEIRWAVNPFRGEAFQKVWTPAAAAMVDYGATYWSFAVSNEGGLDFLQHGIFPTKADFERYWYSERIAQARIEAAGLYQVPVLPTFWTVLGSGRPVLARA